MCFKSISVTSALRCVIFLQVLIHKLSWSCIQESIFVFDSHCCLLDSAFKAQVSIEFTSPFSDCIHFALLIGVAANDKPANYNNICSYWIRCYFYIITFLIRASFSFKDTCGKNLDSWLFTTVIFQWGNKLVRKSLSPCTFLRVLWWQFLKVVYSAFLGWEVSVFLNDISVQLKNSAAKFWESAYPACSCCNFVLLKTFI